MREFFKGWRRKAGLLLLAVALVFSSLWIRSKSLDEALRFTLFSRRNMIRSQDGSLCWFAWAESIEDRGSPTWTSGPVHEKPRLTVVRGVLATEFRYMDLLGAMAFRGEESRFGDLWIPYWIVVWPTTLASVCLIMWKPRKRGPQA